MIIFNHHRDISQEISLQGEKNMLSVDVYSALLERLLSRELVPGQIINRRDIANQLGTSTAPVLEAMKQLEHEGYIETIPRKGTQVKLIDENDVIGSYITRIGIEGMAVRMGYTLGNIQKNGEKLRELSAKADEMRKRYDDHMETWKTDNEFHRALVATCGNEKLCESFEKMSLTNVFYRTGYVFHGEKKYGSHGKLIEKLLDSKSAYEVEIHIRNHILDGKDEIKKLLAI